MLGKQELDGSHPRAVDAFSRRRNRIGSIGRKGTGGYEIAVIANRYETEHTRVVRLDTLGGTQSRNIDARSFGGLEDGSAGGGIELCAVYSHDARGDITLTASDGQTCMQVPHRIHRSVSIVCRIYGVGSIAATGQL